MTRLSIPDIGTRRSPHQITFVSGIHTEIVIHEIKRVKAFHGPPSKPLRGHPGSKAKFGTLRVMVIREGIHALRVLYHDGEIFARSDQSEGHRFRRRHGKQILSARNSRSYYKSGQTGWRKIIVAVSRSFRGCLFLLTGYVIIPYLLDSYQLTSAALYPSRDAHNEAHLWHNAPTHKSQRRCIPHG